MRFLKGMLGRPAQALDHYGPSSALDGLKDTQDEGWDDYGPYEDEDPASDETGPTAEATVTDLHDDPSPRSERRNPDAAPNESEGNVASGFGRPESIKIWELFDDGDEDSEPHAAAPSSRPRTKPQSEPRPVSVPSPAEDRDMSERTMAREALAMIQARSPGAVKGIEGIPGTGGRAKTRLIGFSSHDAGPEDLFRQKDSAEASTPNMFPVGWAIIIEGPGRGASFTLYSGLTQIGRGEDQSISLNFGDHAISRENHASIAYDEEDNMFYLGHGGKANIVRLNGRPVLSTEDLTNGDLIRIGETTLRFVALCGSDFAWDLTEESDP